MRELCAVAEDLAVFVRNKQCPNKDPQLGRTPRSRAARAERSWLLLRSIRLSLVSDSFCLLFGFL